MRFGVGSTVVLREVLQGRIRSARPLRVVEDGDERFVGYLVPRSTVAWPRLADAAQSQTPDQGWRLPAETWQGPGSLFVVPADAGFAAVLFFDPADRRPLGWKVDFFRPLSRHRGGFDTLDQAFDLLVELDGRWRRKDLDDLAQLRRLGLLAGDEADAFDAARAQVERWLTPSEQPDGHPGGPFGEGWTDWRPDASWPPLPLPDGWDDLSPAGRPAEPPPEPPRMVTGGGWRSATGIRLLDGDGAVWFDLDLAGATLLTGHATPSIVEAQHRQLALGWHTSADHPAIDALLERLQAVLPTGWAVTLGDGGLPGDDGARRDPGQVADLDAALAAHGWPFDVAAACASSSSGRGRFGSVLFGGLPAAVGVGPIGPASAAGRAAVGHAPPSALGVIGALGAVTALEVLRLASADAVTATTEQAERLRRAHGLTGDGIELAAPAGWRAPGVVVPLNGRGLLALGVDTDDLRELDDRLAHWMLP